MQCTALTSLQWRTYTAVSRSNPSLLLPAKSILRLANLSIIGCAYPRGSNCCSPCSLLPACLTQSLDSHPSGLKLGKSSNFYVFASQLLCVIELIIIIIINNTTTIFNIIIVITIALHCNGRILNKNCNKSFFYQKFHVGGQVSAASSLQLATRSLRAGEF